MKIKKILLLLSVITLLCSCDNTYKKTVSGDLKIIESKPVKLELKKFKKVYSDADSLHFVKANPKYRLVVYIDSSECSPCRIDRMFYWNYFMDKTEKITHNVDFMFIVAPRKNQLEDTYLSIESSGLKRPIYVDEKYLFRKKNIGISNNILYHVFLIDRNNYVRFIGNPLRNKKLFRIYRQVILAE